MPAPTRDPSVAGLPRQLGRYTLVRKLATGGMAELFLAIQRSVGGFEKLIVIKRILPSMNQDQAFIEMLLHEARIAATLSHPNVVQVFDLGMVDGAYFIAMEHVQGEDLRSIVRQLKSRNAIEFPMEHALSIVLGVCAGLAYAHEKRDLNGAPLNIVHRDVSPQNVIVTFSGDVKVVDFGIAKSDARPGEDTESGRLKGKVPYMSPEQARGEGVDWRGDIFAVGVILFELTTGRRLFKTASEYETLKLICDREYPLPSSVRPGYPPALEAIVMRALTKSREERWQSAREMQEALEEFVRQDRIGASRTSLSKFMELLFEEKLAGHKAALLHDKVLADSVAVETLEAAAVSGIESGRPWSLGPTTMRTVTDARVAGQSRTAIVLAAIGLLALVGTASGAARSWSKRTPEIAPEHSAAAAPVVAPAHDRGVIAIASFPAGATIVVNGERSQRTTPATLTSVALGVPIVVALSADGFEPASQTVTLTDAEPSGAISMVLERRPVRGKPELPSSSPSGNGTN
jgi:serine/threonine-protein kinase